MTDAVSLNVNGRRHRGFTQVQIERAITQGAGAFHLAMVEAPQPDGEPGWPVNPFDAVELRLGDDLVLTGHVEVADPSFGQNQHAVQVSGRSKPGDLVDCNSEVDGGEFRAAKLDAIARAICQPFGLEVVVAADMGGAFPVVEIDRQKTAWQFLEELCRLRGVLITDDPQGRVVLTTVGQQRAAGRLEQGVNILHGSAKLDVTKRFSKYVVRSQTQIGSASGTWEDVDGEGTAEPAGGGVAAAVHGEATDPGVPRYRPHITTAEAALDQAGAQARARWQASYARGRAAQAKLLVPGWRDAEGALWRPNTLVSVKVPWLRLDQDLLVVGVAYQLGPKDGRTTSLTLGPVEGYTPDPGQVKRRQAAGGDGADTWGDVK
jgi:prophage tail gpP-like protein